MVLGQEEHRPKIKMRIPLPQRPAGDREEHVKLQSYVNEKKMLYWTVLDGGTQVRKLWWSQWDKR